MHQAAPSSAVTLLMIDPDTTPIVTLATVPPARPGHFAEREELDAALKAGTREALRLFIDRHPQSRYRPEAEEALRRLETPLQQR